MGNKSTSNNLRSGGVHREVDSQQRHAREQKEPSRKGPIEYDSIKPNEFVGEVLASVPLLARLSDEERARLGGVLEEKRFKKGEFVVKQGDDADGLFIIVKGVALVTQHDVKNKGSEIQIGMLTTGDYFGEAALLNASKRNATVTADSDLRTMYCDREAFHVLFQGRLNVQFPKRKAVSAETADDDNGKVIRYPTLAPVNAVKQKDKAVRELLMTAVESTLLFESLLTGHRNLIIDEMWRAEFKEGTTIIRQGERGDNLYVVESGVFDIFITNDNKKGEKVTKKVAERGKGTAFGELALMYNAPRAATVTARTDCVVWMVDRFTFRRILANVSDTQLQENQNFLSKVQLLAPLSARERSKIAEALEVVTFEPGGTIIKQGSPGIAMYILRAGDVSCSIDGAEVKRYTEPGDYFGERALLKDEPCAATLTAVTAVQCLKLDRIAFGLLLGPLEHIMSERQKEYTKSMSDLSLKKDDEKDSKDDDEVVSKKDDLVVLGTLGKGSFGHVQLVKDPKTGRTYALKAVNKAQIVQTGQQGHIMSEKRVLAQMHHPFIIRLYKTYKDHDRLYFLLEASLGGDLFSVLRARTYFDEDTARFYAACVVLTFEYMHERNMVYRDLKPENLLLDEQGYIKVTDFGFAKVVNDRTYTLCGTPDYLAPEIVAGKGHAKGVDWWTLGVLIYEMLASYPPFYDEDPMKTYAKILHGAVTWPSHFSKEAVHLIQKLLHPVPFKRIGVVKGGAKLIKEHAWFDGFDWDALYNRKLPAPIVPTVKSREDLGNYESNDNEVTIIPYKDDGSNWDADF